MKKILLLGAVVLLASPALPAFAVPMCDGPDFSLLNADGKPIYNEQEMATAAELQLHSHGIKAHLTRWWNGCLQTFVQEDGRDVMKFYDPDTYEEIPVN